MGPLVCVFFVILTCVQTNIQKITQIKKQLWIDSDIIVDKCDGYLGVSYAIAQIL